MPEPRLSRLECDHAAAPRGAGGDGRGVGSVGNPSSVHAEGRQARRLVEDARAAVAAAVGARAAERGLYLRRNRGQCAGADAGAAARRGRCRCSGCWFRRSSMPRCSPAGGFQPRRSARSASRAPAWSISIICATLLADGPPALVSVMLANNETGAVQPVAEAAEIVHAAGGLLHVDAIQAFGKIPFNINDVGCRSCDAFCAQDRRPQGRRRAGRWPRACTGLEPLLRGGGQEHGRRAGTENVAGIAGFGAAVRAAMRLCRNDAERLESLRDRLGKWSCGRPRARSSSRTTCTVAEYHPVHGSRPEGRNRRDRLRSRRDRGIFGLRLLLGQGAAVPCAGGHGVRPRIGPGSGAAQSGLVTTEADIDRCLEAWRKLAGTLLKGSDETRLERF